MGRKLRLPRPPLPRFAVAWFPQFPGLEQLEAFRGRHDPMAALIPAHLSLVFPFPTALTALQLSSHVRKVVSGWPVIPVSFRGIRPAASEFVFLMAQRGAPAVTGLHDRLYTRSFQPHLRRELAYEPHITLARCPEPGRLDTVLAEAGDCFRNDLSTVLRVVTLLSVHPDGKIARLGDFPLDSR